MLKKRRQLWRKTRSLGEMKSPEEVEQPLRAPHYEQVPVFASVCHFCFVLCMFTAL